MNLDNIVLDHVYEVTPTGALDICAIREVKRLVHDKWGFSAEFSDDFSWGKENLTKRVMVDLGIAGRISMENAGELGSLIGSLYLPPLPIRFRFSEKFDWGNGDYGDRGSCAFNQGHSMFKVLQYNKALAIQFLDKKDNGIGRCLMALEPEGGLRVLFNAYGKMYADDPMARSVSSTASRQDNKVSSVAALMKQFVGTDYKRIDFSVNGSNEEPVFVNGGFGYVLGSWGEIRLARGFDLRMKVDIIPRCEKCRKYVNPGELIETPAAKAGGYTHLCARCKSAYEFSCGVCGKVGWKKGDNFIQARDGNVFCTPKCASEAHYRKCAHCDRWSTTPNIVWMEALKAWLDSECAGAYSNCIFCYKTTRNEEFQYVIYSPHPETQKPREVACCPTCAKNIEKTGNPKGLKVPNEVQNELQEVAGIAAKRRKKAINLMEENDDEN